MLNREEFDQQLTSIEAPKERIQFANKHAWQIRRSYPQQTLSIAASTLEWSEQLNDQEGIAYSYRNSGTAYYLLSVYENGLRDLHKAQTLFEGLENDHALASTIRTIGNIYHSIEEDDKAIEYYFKALEITERIGDRQGSAYNCGNLGYVYQKQGQFEKAINYMNKTFDALLEIDDKLGLADVLNNMGKVHHLKGHTEKALELYHQSLENSTLIHHLRGIANASTNIGSYYTETGNSEKALHYHEKAYQAAEEMGEKTLLYQIVNNIATTYEAVEDYKSALLYHKKYEALKSEVLANSQKSTLHAVKSQFDLQQAETEKELYKLKNIELANAKEAIEEKNKELERLSIVADKMNEAVIITDASGRIEFINDGLIRNSGYSREEFDRYYGTDLTLQQISSRANIDAIIDGFRTSSETVFYDSTHQRADGSSMWTTASLKPVYLENGELHKIIVVYTDITERKRFLDQIEQKNKDITDSINYAKRIQDAMLPKLESMRKALPNSFVLYQPRDIVSGDFYWFQTVGPMIVFAVVDCTGHGVPGAFMSMIGNDYLTQIITDHEVSSPGQALAMLDNKIKQTLKQNTGTTESTHDGMDMALCAYNTKTGELDFAGAKRPLYLIRDGKLTVYKGSKYSVGGRQRTDKSFENQTISTRPKDTLYLFSDGYVDQFGGTKGKKFMGKPFRNLLTKIHRKSFDEQRTILKETIEQWRGNLEQVDDICILGIQL